MEVTPVTLTLLLNFKVVLYFGKVDFSWWVRVVSSRYTKIQHYQEVLTTSSFKKKKQSASARDQSVRFKDLTRYVKSRVCKVNPDRKS